MGIGLAQAGKKVLLIDGDPQGSLTIKMCIRDRAGKYRDLCVVGDDDQSIYKFRGANIKNILNFEQEFPDATVIKLEQNYRSTGNILDAANAVISNNVGRKDKQLWTDNGEGEKIKFCQFDTGYDEAEYIACLLYTSRCV